MVTEKMIEAAARVLNRRLADGSGLHGVSRDMLEAALSTDAEPVAIYKGNGLIDCGDGGHHNIELLKLIPANTPLYASSAFSVSKADRISALQSWSEQKYGERFSVSACHDLLNVLNEYAPPAPTVAVKVKALRWKGPDSYGEYHSLDGLWGYIIRCEDDGHWLTEVGDYFRSPEAAQAAAQADYDTRIRSALSAQVQDVAIPEGWQLVPKEPTQEMLGAADDKRPLPETFLIDAYRAMLAAAPAAKLEEKP